MHKMPPLLLLCGGKSKRWGIKKGLAKYQGEPWLFWQINRCHQSGILEVAVVLGYDSDLYKAALENFPKPRALQISVINNPHPETGPFSSILAGFRELSPTHKAFFVLPADVPCPDENVWRNLISALAEGKSACTPTYEGEGGHPVLLSRHFLQVLSKLPLDSLESRLDVQIQKLDRKKKEGVPVRDPKILLNLNTPKEFEKWRTLPTGPNAAE